MSIDVAYTDALFTSDSHTSATHTTREFSLTAGKTVDYVQVTAPLSTVIEGDFVFIEKSSHLNVTGNLAGFATSRFLGWRVGSANIVLKDIDADYWNATPINVADMVLLYAGSGASPTADTKIFGGLVNSKGKTSLSGTHYTNLVCVDWTKALEAVVVDKRYVAQDDDVLVDDLIDIGRGSAASPFNVKTYWELLSTTSTVDDLTATSLTLEWRQVSLLEALTELAEILSIHTASGKGADFVCTPSEYFIWDLIGSASGLQFVDRGLFTESDYISLDLTSSSFDLRTQVNLIGRISIPSDGDEWTQSTTGWTAEANSTVSAPAKGYDYGVGSSWIQLIRTGGAGAGDFGMYRDLTAMDVTKLGGSLVYPTIGIQARKADANITALKLILETSAGNYFTHNFDMTEIPTSIEPRWFVLPLQQGSGEWIQTGSADWTNITRLYIRGTTSVAGTTTHFDGLHFEGNVVEIAKDTRTGKGEGQYGKRELTVYDPTPREVTSATGGAGHRERAKAELFKWRDEIIQGSMTLDNKLNVNPGDSLQITSSPFNFSSKAFRVTGIHQFWNSAMDYIQSTLEITDFLITTFPRGAGGLYGLLIRQGFLGRYETQLTALRENELIGGITSNTTEYSS